MGIIEGIKKRIRKNLDERGAEKEFYKNEFQREFKKERLTYLKKKARKDAISKASGGGSIMGALEGFGKNAVSNFGSNTPPDNMFGLGSPRALNNLFAQPKPAMPRRKKRRREDYIILRRPKTRRRAPIRNVPQGNMFGL